MGAETDSRLLHLAESISDRAPVPWGEVRSQAGELAAVVEGLERVQALAEAFAASQATVDGDRQSSPAARWGQLEILEPLGDGAFGEVFRARDPNLDREVALKLRRAGPGPADSAGRRLLEEARRLARVRHPNVVTVHGADLCDGRVGIWTELVDGQTLEQRLEADGPMGPGEAVAVGLDLCRALAAIHAAGLVHGDVKTTNVLRERGGRIVLTDLGSATEAGATPVTGSPATLAPEVLAGGPATAVADLYSLGLLLSRLLSGRAKALAGARPRSLRDLRPDLPPAVIRVVERAADPDPERRYPSAGALEQALARATDDAGMPLTGEASDPGPRRSWRRAARAAAGVVAVAAALLAWQLMGPPDTAPPEVAQTAVADVTGERGGDTSSAAVGQVAAAAPAAAPTALEVEVAMLRTNNGGTEVLADGDRVRPGDRLALEIVATEPVHVWLVNEDMNAEVFLLFPIPGLDLGNPLPAGRRHRLPGRLANVPQHWQVTSSGGRERFLVIASRHGLPELEHELAGMAAASEGVNIVNRGVGGLAPAPLAGGGRLDALAERLADNGRNDGSIWLRRLELVNP